MTYPPEEHLLRDLQVLNWLDGPNHGVAELERVSADHAIADVTVRDVGAGSALLGRALGAGDSIDASAELAGLLSAEGRRLGSCANLRSGRQTAARALFSLVPLADALG